MKNALEREHGKRSNNTQSNTRSRKERRNYVGEKGKNNLQRNEEGYELSLIASSRYLQKKIMRSDESAVSDAKNSV